MKRYQAFGVVLFAVCALGMVAVSSASAAHQWLTLAGAAVTKVESSTTVGSFALKNKKIPALFGGGEITYLCMGQILGTRGPNGTDLITLIEGLTSTEKDELSCVVSASTNSICKSGTLVIIKFLKLPWASKFVLVGTTIIYDDLTEDNGGTGNIGLTAVCNSISDECVNKLELMTFVKNIATGAEFNFNETEKYTCTIGEGFLSATGMVTLGALVN